MSSRVPQTFEQLLDLFDGMNLAIAVCDYEGRITQSNPAFLELVGYDAGDIEGDSLQHLCKDPSVSQEVRALKEGRTERVTVTFDLNRADDSTVPVEARLSRVDREGASGVVGVFLDISTRETEKRRMEKSEERFRALFESAPVAIAIRDADNRAIMVNPAMEKLFGRDERELVGHRNKEFLMQGHVFEGRDRYRALVDGTYESVTFERPFQTGDGATIWARGLNTAVRDASGNFLYGIQVIEDRTEARNREQALEYNEQRYRTLFEQSPIGIAILSNDRVVIDANETAKRMLGRPDLVGQRFWGFAYETEGLNRFEHIEDRGLGPQVVERHLKPQPGAAEWVQYTTASVSDDDGNFLYAVRMIEDITEKKRAETNLEESERLFRSFFHSAPIALSIKDSQARNMRVNPAMEALFGRNQESLIGRANKEFLSPAFQRRNSGSYSRIVDGQEREELLERAYLRSDGTSFWAMVKNTPVSDDEGTFRYMIQSVEDITPLRQREESLKASEERFRSLFEAMPIGVALLSTDGVIRQANSALYEILGRDQSDVIGEHFREWLHGERPATSITSRMMLKQGIDLVEDELEYVRGDGKVIVGRDRTRAIRGTDGEVEYFIRTFEDVTARHDAEQRLVEREEFLNLLIDRMPSGLAVMDETATYTLVNPAGAAMVGYEQEEVVGMHPWDFLEHDPEIAESIKATVPFTSATEDTFTVAEAVVRKGGGTFPASIDSIHFESQGTTHRLSIWRDLTRDREAQARIAAQVKQDAEADERERVARELHDTVVQDLTGLALRLELAVRMARQGDTDLKSYLEQTEDQARAAIRGSRNAVWRLWDNASTDGPLKQSIEVEAHRELTPSSIAWTVRETGQTRAVPRNVQANLLRIVREALSNVVKHAQASKVQITLRFAPEAITIDVVDDGVGVDAKGRTLADSSGFGMISMYERAKLLGGTVERSPVNTGGTRVTIVSPG